MKIKSFILSCVLAGASLGAFAQKFELNSAKSNYDQFNKLKSANSAALGKAALKTAKESIDKAVTHEKTMNDPSTWTYKALIYSDLALLDSVPATSTPIYTQAKEALAKAKELDKEGANKANLDQAGVIMASYELNKGVKAYQKEQFAEAYEAFNNSLAYRPGDTTLTYYAGISAANAKNNKGAIEQYEKLIKTNYSINKQVYLHLSRLYTMEKDTASAIRIAAEGSAKFPDDSFLATQEIELGLMTGKEKEVINKISQQAEKDPKNKLYPYYLGIAYNSIKDYQKAEDAYKKALEIDPNYLDANLNISGLILNKGIEIYNKANKLPQSKQKEYDDLKKKATIEFDRALPYLQKSTEINPKSRMALENLRTYYIATRNNSKAEEITKRLKDL